MKYTLTSNKGFYIGDICYVLSDEVYHDIWGNQNSYQEGKIQVGNYAFAVDRTAYGDGTYTDNNGREYSVDAGVIGCVPFELIDMDKLHEDYDPGADPIDILNDFGLFIEGSQAEFETNGEGLFVIAVDNQIAIMIDTNHEADYEEDDEYSSEDYDLDDGYNDDYDEEYFEEYNGEESADEQFNEPIDNSNIGKVLSQARDNPEMFQIHGTGEVTSDGVTVKFIYYANPRKPLDGTYIDIDSSDPNFEKVFKGHLNKYLPQDKICEIILKQLTDYLESSDKQQSAKEAISDDILSKLDSFNADKGNYPLEGASIYYDSQYLRFYFEGIDEDSAKEKVSSFLRSQGFDIKLQQLYTTKYGSSLTIFLPTSSLTEPSSKSVFLDYTTVIYPDNFPIPETEINVVRTIIVKNLTTPIPADYFSMFPNLKTAKILGNVKIVYGFIDCEKLTTVVIGEQAKAIDDKAFAFCSSLTSVTIGNSVTYIGTDAFSGCKNLTSITIPDSVTSIGSFAFAFCSSLTSAIIPNSVTSIDNYTFYQCKGLTSITIPDSVTSIGAEAFSNCENLKSVTFGKNSKLTKIGSYAFYYCNNLTTITIPDTVTSIGWNAFEDCTSLTSVTIPNSVMTIGAYVFKGCPALSDINYRGTIKEWGEINSRKFLFNPVRVHCTDGTINT